MFVCLSDLQLSLVNGTVRTIPSQVTSDSRPVTPTLPFSTRKKNGTGTSSFNIDNIIIPYFIACSACLEKLEYKEIITPKWCEIGSISLVVDGGHVNVKSSTLSSGESEKTHHWPHASRNLNLDLKEPVQEKPQENVEVCNEYMCSLKLCPKLEPKHTMHVFYFKLLWVTEQCDSLVVMSQLFRQPSKWANSALTREQSLVSKSSQFEFKMFNMYFFCFNWSNMIEYWRWQDNI